MKKNVINPNRHTQKMEKKKKNYPYWDFKTNREWLRDVRKRWVDFDKKFRLSQDNIFRGCAFYPKEVYEWLNKIRKEKEKMDKLMKQYYKNA